MVSQTTIQELQSHYNQLSHVSTIHNVTINLGVLENWDCERELFLYSDVLAQSLTHQSSSSRMHVLNHNWSATKQRPHLQSVAEISRHSALPM